MLSGQINCALSVIKLAVMTAGLAVMLSACATGAGDYPERQLVQMAMYTVDGFVDDPGKSRLLEHARQARAIFIVPEVIRGAWVIGATSGSGVLLARNRRSEWSPPAFYNIGAASFGFQFGGDASEIILVVMTERGLNSLLRSSMKLGADASVAAGSSGERVGAGTSMTLSADIIAYARSKGMFMGISLEGAAVKVANASNEAYYRMAVTPEQILLQGWVENPQSDGLRRAITRATKPVRSDGH
ncbi:MAG: lipid-binding SYLF domain-containing protein [Nitrospiraceae bacterium]